MSKLMTAAFTLAMVLSAGRAQAEQSAPSAPSLPPVRHLVYRFGYNTPAADSGRNTGTTTVDFAGIADDGGVKITATDVWWNSTKPQQSYTCELYATGSVACKELPNAISPIQIAIVPLLAKEVFAGLSSGPTATWNPQWNVRATFFPGAGIDFAGQVDTWNCAYTFGGQGTIPNTTSGLPLNKVQLKGSMTQQGGRRIVANQQANILFDPRLNVPVYVDELLTFVPQVNTDRYTVELKLIRL